MRELVSLPEALLSNQGSSSTEQATRTKLGPPAPPNFVVRQPDEDDRIFYFRDDVAEIRANLTSREYRFVFYLLGMLDPGNPQIKNPYFKVNVRAFAKLTGLDLNSLWTQLKQLTHGLCCKQLYICGSVFPGGRYPGLEVVNWLDSYGLYEGDGYLTVKLTPSIVRIYNHILRHLQPEQQNLIPCGPFFKLHSIYAQRLYTWANCRRGQKLVKVDLPRLRTLLLQSAEPTVLEPYHHFKQRAIEPAVNEISEKTDLLISYSKLEPDRSVHKLLFTIQAKHHAKSEHPPRLPAPSLQPSKTEPHGGELTQQSLALGDPDPAPVHALLEKISQVAPLTESQQQEVFNNAAELGLDFVTGWWSYALAHGKNPAALFCDAMKRKRPLVRPTKQLPVTPAATPKRAEIDWDWKSYLLSQGMPAANLPKDLAQLDQGIFQRYILPEHRRRLRSTRTNPVANPHRTTAPVAAASSA